MTNYDRRSFSDLNAYAAQIADQNLRYVAASKLGNPDSKRNAQNRIALQQIEHVAILGEFSAELPYRELALEHMAVEYDLELAEFRAQFAGEYRVLGAVALADRLGNECYLQFSDLIDQNLTARLDWLRSQGDETASQRLEDLHRHLGNLSSIYEVVSRPWPVPQSRFIEEPLADIGPDLDPTSKWQELDELYEVPEPVLISRPEAGGRLGRSWEVAGRVQKEASRLIIEYIAVHPDQTITAEELADNIYEGCGAELTLDKKRSRILSLMWADIKRANMSQPLKQMGIRLDIGSAAYIAIDQDGHHKPHKIGTVRRVWRGTSQRNQDQPRFFKDTVYFDRATGQRITPDAAVSLV